MLFLLQIIINLLVSLFSLGYALLLDPVQDFELVKCLKEGFKSPHLHQ